jgi:ribosomal-protein-alanine N-acetyltransferase
MIFFQDLYSLEQFEKQKFIDWKGDIDLCDLIMSSPVNLNLEQLDNWIEKNSTDNHQYFKCVYRKSDNKLIGLARLMFIDLDSRIAEIGLYIGDIEDRKGKYGTEILNNLVKVAISEFNLNKVFAKIQNDNIGSLRLFENAGFIVEGCLREHYFSLNKNQFITVVVLSKFLEK